MPPLLRLLRPHQWVKNVFVLAGVFFAGSLFVPEVLGDALRAFAAFCLASSAVYVLNDLVDREADRRHPRKRLRPLAAGTVTSSAAMALGLACAAGAFVLGASVSRELVALLAAYAVVNGLYSRWLKHVVLLDVFCIASGFLLRLLAGTWGIGVPPSKWFLLCTFLLSLFLGFSKRYAERTDASQEDVHKRTVVADYTPEFLRVLLGVTLACTLMSYGLYTMSPETVAVHGTTRLMYTVPFAAFVLFRYLWLVVAKGYGENLAAEMVREPGILTGVAGYVLVSGVILSG